MFLYTNPYTHIDTYINYNYIISIECYPGTQTLVLDIMPGKELRLEYLTDEEYCIAKDWLLRKNWRTIKC